MGLGRIIVQFGFAVFVLATPSGTARGDVLDGHWCSIDGRRIMIDGEKVITQGGSEISGEYDPHHLIYVVPESEWKGDKMRADIVLVNANLAHVRFVIDVIQGHAPQPEAWTRCEEPYSGLRTHRRRHLGWPLIHRIGAPLS